MTSTRGYVPALGYDALTALYDPVVAMTTRERTFKRALIGQARIADRDRVLDLACGTGTLALWIKREHPTTHVTGIDGDPRVLSRARAKAASTGVAIRFDQGMSYDLPYPDGAFDRVLTSLFFHHLSPADKRRTVHEVLRVLRPSGELHVADWGKATNGLMRFLFYGIQLLDGFQNTTENVAGRLPEIFASAGFEDVAVTRAFSTVFGTMTLYRATRPRQSQPSSRAAHGVDSLGGDRQQRDVLACLTAAPDAHRGGAPAPRLLASS